jgi:transposase
MCRLHGRSRKGERCHDSASGSWQTMTMTSSIRLDGSTECLVFEGATDKVSFGVYMEECLLQQLRDNDIVIMDNLSSHKNSFDLSKFELRNITIKYLPPYSPDFNPIEQMWSKIKSSLREYRATTSDELFLAIQKAFKFVTSSDAQGWFKHCGYFQ